MDLYPLDFRISRLVVVFVALVMMFDVTSSSALCPSERQNYNETSGVFSNYAGIGSLYPPNSFCEWEINVLGAASLVVSFSAFATEANYDYVYIYSGNSTSGRRSLIRRLSGVGNANNGLVPTPTTVPGGSATIFFAADTNTEEVGFIGYYNATFTLYDSCTTAFSCASCIPFTPTGRDCGWCNTSRMCQMMTNATCSQILYANQTALCPLNEDFFDARRAATAVITVVAIVVPGVIIALVIATLIVCLVGKHPQSTNVQHLPPSYHDQIIRNMRAPHTYYVTAQPVVSSAYGGKNLGTDVHPAFASASSPSPRSSNAAALAPTSYYDYTRGGEPIFGQPISAEPYLAAPVPLEPIVALNEYNWASGPQPPPDLPLYAAQTFGRAPSPHALSVAGSPQRSNSSSQLNVSPRQHVRGSSPMVTRTNYS